MLNPKEIRKELTKTMIPVMEHLKNYGTDKYNEQITYEIKHKGSDKPKMYTATFAPHGDNMVEVTIEFFYTLTIKFHAPVVQLHNVVPELQATRFAQENEHVIMGVHKFQKEIH